MATAYLQRFYARIQPLFSINNPNQLDPWAVSPFLCVVGAILIVVAVLGTFTGTVAGIAFAIMTVLYITGYLVTALTHGTTCSVLFPWVTSNCIDQLAYAGAWIVFPCAFGVLFAYEGKKLVDAIHKAAHLVAPLEDVQQ